MYREDAQEERLVDQEDKDKEKLPGVEDKRVQLDMGKEQKRQAASTELRKQNKEQTSIAPETPVAQIKAVPNSKCPLLQLMCRTMLE